jgi:hypothetical protein
MLKPARRPRVPALRSGQADVLRLTIAQALADANPAVVCATGAIIGNMLASKALYVIARGGRPFGSTSKHQIDMTRQDHGVLQERVAAHTAGVGRVTRGPGRSSACWLALRRHITQRRD